MNIIEREFEMEKPVLYIESLPYFHPHWIQGRPRPWQLSLFCLSMLKY